MSFQNIGAVGGGGAAQQSIDPAMAVADNVAGAVGGAAARLGIPPEISDALTQGALSGDQKLFGDALGAILKAAMQMAAQGQSAQGGPSAPASPAGASGPAPGGASPSGAGGGANPIELLVQLLSALGVPPQMIKQIVNAVAQNAQAQGAGGAAPMDAVVPGVQAA